ncbi:MAG: 5-formyltetrahydrofolate cyclo-ligase [Candidatus Omnitrophica bacterium]|nr:5-formyltetrahydrofolate cyclo-ligase [Candidatus Omnitrophota bacterium]
MIEEKKLTIRKRILNLLKNQKEEERLYKSQAILKQFFKIPEYSEVKTILFYFAFGGEVETMEMIKRAQHEGKKVALPFVLLKEKKLIPILIENLEEDLEHGPYGIPQPYYNESKILDLKNLDMAVIPGLAFDKRCYRLGRGIGFYDRFLARFPQDKKISSVGLAFDFQLVDSLPTQEHDVPVSRVVVNG